MKNIKHVSYRIFIVVFAVVDILISCVPSQQTSLPTPQVAQAAITFTPTSAPTMPITPLPTETPKPTNTSTQISSSTPVPAPTVNPVDSEVEDLFQSSKFEQDAVIRILEYLYQHPESQYRQALLYKVIGLSSSKSSQWWVIEDWLKEFVVEPFNQTGGLSTEFEMNWENWGEIFSGDLDGNNEPDYILTMGNRCTNCEGEHIYWIYQINDQYKIIPLPTIQGDIFVEVFAFDDLTGDNQSELVYSIAQHNLSGRTDTLRILTWQNDQLTELLSEFWDSGIWGLINGDVVVQDEDKDGVAEIVITQGSTGYPGLGPFLPYKIHLNLLYGEYVPVEQSMFDDPGGWSNPLANGWRDAELITWQRAKQLLHTNHFDEAIEEFGKLANFPPSLFSWVNYGPYALFNIGVIYTILGDEVAAQDIWEQITVQYPSHPVGIDVIKLKNILKTKEDLGYTCAWLRENAGQWKAIRWMASDKAIYDSKWIELVEGQGIHPDEARTMLKADEIDYAKERETFEYIGIRPGYYRHHTDWWGFCHPMFLIPLYTWQQQDTISNQMSQRDLNWQTISIDYDLNGDTTPDVIGFLETNGKRVPLAFISQDDVYQPLFIMQPYPLEAINIWDVTQYKYDREFSQVDMKVITSGIDNAPQVIIDNSQTYQWIGHRFQYLPVKSTEPTIEPELPNPLDQAMEQLFRYKQPQEALNILQEYDPDDNGKVVQLYFQALAFQYDKRYEQAQTIFNKLIKDYPDTIWTSLAKEKLELEIYD